MPLYNPPAALEQISVDAGGYLIVAGGIPVKVEKEDPGGTLPVIYRIKVKEGAVERTIYETEGWS